MIRRIAFAPFLLAMAAMTAEAARIDQSYEPPANPLLSATVGDLGLGQKGEVAQSFVAGISGRISEVDLYLEGQGDGLLLEVRRTTPSGLPSDSPADLLGAAFASSAVSPTGYHFVAFRFDGLAANARAGDQLALVLVAPASGSYNWGGSAANPYPGGGESVRSPFYGDRWSVPVAPASRADLGFRTFVDPVPEPSTLAIVLAGLAGWKALAGRRGDRTRARGRSADGPR